jgi:hypothetical protein
MLSAGTTTIDPGGERALAHDPPTGGTYTNNGNLYTLLSLFEADYITLQGYEYEHRHS